MPPAFREKVACAVNCLLLLAYDPRLFSMFDSVHFARRTHRTWRVPPVIVLLCDGQSLKGWRSQGPY